MIQGGGETDYIIIGIVERKRNVNTFAALRQQRGLFPVKY